MTNNNKSSRVSNMTSPSTGKPVANQFIIEEKGVGWNGNFTKRLTFQSYDSTIAVTTQWAGKDGEFETEVELDETYWNYSHTTRKYRNQFLGEHTQETQRKIDSGVYKLVNLNK